ncbi:MAG TPA: SHOCT domain-containing protein [Acidimicrobiales bacterium]
MMSVAGLVLAQAVRNGDHMDWDDSGWHWVMFVVMVLVVLLVTGAVVWAVTSTARLRDDGRSPAAPSPTPSRPTARDILDERYARGELDTTDYEERRSRLD